MDPTTIREDLADCKQVNRFIRACGGKVFWVFGMTEDNLLVRRWHQSRLWPLSLVQYAEVEQVLPRVSDLYAECKARGIPIGNHESDLYIPKTDETELLVMCTGSHWPRELEFDNQVEGGRWYDIPFAFTPFWERINGIAG